MKDSSLTPRIAETAKGLWLTHVADRVLRLQPVVGRLEPWDAVIHAFSVAGLGGFSNRDASPRRIFDSVGVELVTHRFRAARRAQLCHPLSRAGEAILGALSARPEIPFWFFGVLALSRACSPCICSPRACSGWRRGAALRRLPRRLDLDLARACHPRLHAVADVRADVDPLPRQLAACSGSTGGGIKMMRAMILYKQGSARSCARCIRTRWCPVRLGRNPVPENILHAVLGFSFMYMVSIVSLTLSCRPPGWSW